MVQKSPHESILNQPRDTNCTFKPEITRKARSIQRSESVESRLFHDAYNRKRSKAVNEEKKQLNEKPSKMKYITAQSQQVLKNKILGELDIAWNLIIKESEKVQTIEEFTDILRKINFMD